jgi:hypothetical protein
MGMDDEQLDAFVADMQTMAGQALSATLRLAETAGAATSEGKFGALREIERSYLLAKGRRQGIEALQALFRRHCFGEQALAEGDRQQNHGSGDRPEAAGAPEQQPQVREAFAAAYALLAEAERNWRSGQP